MQEIVKFAAEPVVERLVRMPEVCAMLGVRPRSVYRMIDRGQLPKPVKIAGRCKAYRLRDIQDYIQRALQGQG